MSFSFFLFSCPSVVKSVGFRFSRQFYTIPVVIPVRIPAPKCTRKHFRAPIKFKIFWGGMPPDPPRDGGPKGPPGALVSINF